MREKIGLVLGGGGSRGAAHVGVLQVLVREQIPVDLIVGTSMGGIVGAMFASGMNPDEMIKRFESFQGNMLLTMSPFSARSRQRTLRTWIESALKDVTFADLKIPLAIMAADMQHGEEVILDEGPLIPALLASSAMPAIFPPVKLKDRWLADGGVIDSVATHVACERGACRVIAVDLHPPLHREEIWNDPISAVMGLQLPFGLLGTSNKTKMPSMLSAIWRGARVMASYLHESRLKAHPPDVLLRPDVSQYGSLDFKDIQGPIQAGIAETERFIDEIRALVV
jgi:NTE family protein